MTQKYNNITEDSIAAWRKWVVSGKAISEAVICYYAAIILDRPFTFYNIADYTKDHDPLKNGIPINHMGSNIGRSLFEEDKVYKLLKKGKTPKGRNCGLWVTDEYYKRNPHLQLCPKKHKPKATIQTDLFANQTETT